MNFLRNSILRTSNRRRTDSPNNNEENGSRVNVASFETFHKHWEQLEEIILKNDRGAKNNDDNVLAVTSHLEYMVMLISNEIEGRFEFISPCLECLLQKDILNKVLMWSMDSSYICDLSFAVAQSLKRIIDTSKKSGKDILILRNPPIYKPLYGLFERFEDQILPKNLETVLVSLSYFMCVLITREPSFLDLFYNIATIEKEPKFSLMPLLVNNIHHEGPQGQTARDGLVLCMTLAREQQLLAQYIALESNFCHVVATGLSGLYSELPRTLPEAVEQSGMFSSRDILSIKELSNFITSLEFCDSILQIAPWVVTTKLLEYCYNGFLISVLSPALFQDSTGLSIKLLDLPHHVNTMKEILSSTCYLSLCLRCIRNRELIGIFVRFILTHSYEEIPIIDVLIERLSSKTELRLATLHLLHALIDLNCEDIMLALVFKYLLPCGHVMLSQRGNTLQEHDVSGLWAAKFLSLIPSSCSAQTVTFNRSMTYSREVNEAETNSRIRRWSHNSNDSDESRFGTLAFAGEEADYHGDRIVLNGRAPSDGDCLRFRQYLLDASNQIRLCANATQNWRYPYNGHDPPTIDTSKMLNGNQECVLENGDSLIQEETGKHLSCETSSVYLKDIPDVYTYCMEQLTNLLEEMNLASPGQSSGYESFNFTSRPPEILQEDTTIFSKDVQDALEFWSWLREDEDDTKLSDKVEVQTMVDTCRPVSSSVGPFLDTLIRSVDSWLNNSIAVNLALCSLITRLACYPHPLLRSYVLNPYIVLQPSIPGLFSNLATLKQRIDSALSNIENHFVLIQEARAELYSMADAGSKADKSASNIFSRGSRRRGSSILATVSSMFRTNQASAIREEVMEAVPSNSGYRYIHRSQKSETIDPIGRHVAICAALLEEWLNELAALCLEHAVSFNPLPLPLAN